MSLRDSVQVMVVDDMSTSRGLLTQALDQLGIQNYKTESNGRDALSKVLANPVHLVLSDLNMPDLDGLGLLQALRENPVTQRIGFILVTGSPNPDIVARGRDIPKIGPDVVLGTTGERVARKIRAYASALRPIF